MQRDVQDLLADGERVEREVDVGADRLVVTNQRLLAFTPEGEGKNYRHVERPNVEGVALAARSDSRRLLSAGAYLVVAGAVAASGVLIDTDGFLSGVSGGQGAGAIGFGGVIQEVAFWVGLVDDGLIALGALTLVPAVYHVARYWRSRRTVLSVGVAGEDDIDLPTDRVADPNNAVERLRLALDLPTGERGGADDPGPTWGTDP